MINAGHIKNDHARNWDEIKTQHRRRIQYSYLVVVAFVLMIVSLVYVWSHVQMTKLEYRVAAEIGTKERLLAEQKRLKAEMATLRSPKRIEAIAKGALHMAYPERDQVIFIK